MASTIGNLLVKIGADITGLQKGLTQAERSLNRFSNKIGNIGQTMTAGLTLPIAAAGGAALKAAADYEQLSVSFQVLLKDAEKGAKFFEDLKKFAAATPFQMNEVAGAAKVMLGYGFSAEETNKQLQILGDVAAATGGDIQGLSVIMGQGAALGKFMTVDLKQLAMRGIPILQVLGDQLGIHETQVLELAEKSKISYPMVAKAIEDMTKKGGNYFDAMNKQSKTLGGLFSTLKDNATAAFAEIGMSIKDTFKLDVVIKNLSDRLQSVVTWFKGLTDQQRKMIVVTAAVAAAIGPLLIGISGLVKGAQLAVMGFKGILSVVSFLASPVGLIVAAIVAVAAALVYAYQKSEKFRAVVNGLGAAVVEVFTVMAEAAKGLVRGFSEFFKGNIKEANAAFKEAFIKGNPVTAAITQGKRIAQAYSDQYEKTIKAAADEKKFDPYADKNKLLAQMNQAGQQAGAAFSAGFGGDSEEVTASDFKKPGLEFEGLLPKKESDPLAVFNKMKDFSEKIAKKNAEWAESMRKVNEEGYQATTGWGQDMQTIFENLAESAKTERWQTFWKQMGEGAAKFADSAFQAIEWIDGAFQAFTDNRLAAIDNYYANEKKRIEGSRMSEEAKAAALQKLENDTEKKRKKIARAQAIREKILGVIRATIATAVAVTQNLANPILAGIIAAMGAIQIGMIAGQQIPALAEGGLAYGPGLAMVGDNPNSRVDPEVIAPLSKLMNIMGARQLVEVKGVISGRDILLIQERASQDRLRTRGY